VTKEFEVSDYRELTMTIQRENWGEELAKDSKLYYRDADEMVQVVSD
jgi:hypothetical protein